MTKNLTARDVETLKSAGTRTDYYDETVSGLVLRITEQGHKSWSVRYRTVAPHQTPGVERRYTIGTYPKVGLAQARKVAHSVLRRAAEGKDPAGEKQATREGETVADLAKLYLTKHAKVHKKSWRDDDRMLNAEILPTCKNRKVKDLTRREVRDLVEAISDRGSPITANRCLALIRKMLNFAIKRDWIEGNVASLIEKPGAEHSRERVLDDDEIRLVWSACEAERAAMCALTKLRLVTAQRGGELAQIRWTDIEGDWLTLPATATKNGRPHRVYLTETAQGLLQALPRVEGCDYVFPARSGNRPCGDAKKAGQRIQARVLAALQKADTAVEAFDFRAHDLRRTASTRMAEARIPRPDISRVLNHVEGGPRATRVYDRYDGDREKQVALETWERVLLAVLDDKRAGKVLPITTRKGA